MQHLSDDALTSLALDGPGQHDPHVDRCDACSTELAALLATADRLRAAHIEPVEPPAALWERILAEIQADARAAPSPSQPAEAAAPAPDRPTRDLVRRRRRRHSGRALLAACAASAAAAASLVLLMTPLSSPGSTDLSAAALEPLTPVVSAARADVVERDGQRLLIIDADALPSIDGYLDVWLLDADAQQMVSLGIMDAESTQLALPPELDLATYSIVDISIEPYDGDPTHSGNSIWRGALES